MSSAVSAPPREGSIFAKTWHHWPLTVLLSTGIAFAAGCREPSGLYGPARTRVAYPQPPTPPRLIRLGAVRDWQDVEPRPNRFAEWFSKPTAPKPVIRKPGGMCTRDGILYFCDVELAVVYRVDFVNRRMERLPDPDRALSKPVDVAVGEDGRAFVADTDRGAVLLMSSTGTVERIFRIGEAGDGKFRPVGVAVDGDSLYVANIADHNIVVFNATDGQVATTIGQLGDGNGAFHFPTDVVVTATELYVLDMMNCRVQVFSRDGQWQRSFGGPGNRPGFLGRPKRMAVGPDGTIFVADAALQRIHVFDSEGHILTAISNRPQSSPDWTLPNAVCVGSIIASEMMDGLPDDFQAAYIVFVADQVADPRVEVYAFGKLAADGRK